MSLPLVAIVGRPNVGKSTLFNVLLRRRVAIVDPTAGTTRDRVAAVLKVDGRAIELVDTGGLGLVDESRLEAHVNQQVDLALSDADVVVFVVDVRDGITGLDRRVAGRLRKMNRPVVLAANKADGRNLEMDAAEFHALGLGDPIPLSAQNRYNTSTVLEAVMAALPEQPPVPDDDTLRIAILGRRNAGKSTFLNALAGEGRVITSSIPGTTRDAVDIRVVHGDREYTFIDTAGVVKRVGEDDSIEFYAQVRTIEALARCDTCLLLLDIQEEITMADKKIAAHIADLKKPVVVTGNKWDRSKASADEFVDYFQKKLPVLRFAPIAFTSAIEGLNLWETVDVAVDLHAQASLRVDTAEVNRVFARALEERTPRVARSRVPKIYYATQVSVLPPTFVLFVNEPDLFPDAYRRYLENTVRRHLPFSEVPVKLRFRRRTPKDARRQGAAKSRRR